MTSQSGAWKNALGLHSVIHGVIVGDVAMVCARLRRQRGIRTVPMSVASIRQIYLLLDQSIDLNLER